ncbi:MAG TPA: tetratricopeptide repeat protein [Archangium sp.]|uniref:tetratricopeptide repeat protein n=1 Tax=Archangium sp. TaxID=1872627 RepID=UPI002E32210E|nr:tetratricopeptide repeat protein [Archangium sp.]HEX5748047.1 tetratricopeptide repeat protein [Archangium sp.]
MDHARPERLGELVRTLLPIAPELEVHTEAYRLAEAKPGSMLVLIGRTEDADWLNINRPLFASRELRVVLWCTREVSEALLKRAVDFLDWISLRLECPAGPAPYAVAGLRCALAARVPGIVWTGGDLEASFAAARPRRTLRRISAARPYEELVAEAKAAGGREWLAWTEVDGDFRLRRVRWAMAEAGRRTRTILVEPAVRSPGWWEMHARVAEPAEACERLRSAGSKQPGRLAALVDLEPETIQLLGGLLERGVEEHFLDGELLKSADPGAAVGRLAAEQGLVMEKEQVRGRAPPPVMRAFGAERDRIRRLHEAKLNTIEQRLHGEEQVDAEETSFWAASTRSTRFIPTGSRGELAEVLLRRTPGTSGRWDQAANIALLAGDADVAHLWARRAFETDNEQWKVLTQALIQQGRFTEAESLLRRQLQAERTSALARGWILHELGVVLDSQGKYAEAEALLRQSLSIYEQALGTHHPSYGASLHVLAGVLESQGKYAEAEALLRQSLSIHEQALDIHHPNYGASLHELARVLQSQGKYAEAEALFRQSLSIYEQALGTHHPSYGASLHELAGVLESQGKYAEAEALLRQSLSIDEQALGTHHPSYGVSLHELARVLESQGKYAEAEALLRQSLSIYEQALGTHHPHYGVSLHVLASVLQQQGRYAEAEALLRQSHSIIEQALGPRHPRLCAVLANLGSNLAAQNRPQEGEAFLLRAASIARAALGPKHPETAQFLTQLARVQAALKKPEAAITAQQAMDALLGALGPEHPITKEALPGLRQILAGNN